MTIALVTSDACLNDDHDMPSLIAACRALTLDTDICAWDDPSIDWSRYSAVVLRSPWDYADRMSAFLSWCENVTIASRLFNPIGAVRWSLDKHYLADLARRGVPVVPTRFVEPSGSPISAMGEFLTAFPDATDMVIKPAIGCNSRGVQRFKRAQKDQAIDRIAQLAVDGLSTVLQPYLPSIDMAGESNLIYFDGIYSHAIRKGALLCQDGVVNVPTYEFRSRREAQADERAVANAALLATAAHLGLRRPLLYARVDLIRDRDGAPRLLELEIAEPSLSLPLAEEGAARFARSLSQLAMAEQGA